jgi:signal transduction histidine kinase
VSVLNIDDLPKSLLRSGLKTDELRSLEGMMIKRGAIVSLVLIIIGVIVITFTSTSQSLKTVENQYKRISTFSGSILENMADGVITTTMDGKIKIFNRSAEQILNIKEIDALEKELSEIPVLRDLPPVIASSLKNKTPIKYSEYKITINGSEEILGVSSTFTKNTLNEYDSFTVVFRNMTKIRRMEETAKQNEKLNAMGELAGKVAHEIRNPLNAISMIAQRFKREFKPAGKIEEYDLLNEVLLTETKRVNGIIEQFLKYAKPQRPVFSKVPARKFIEEIRLIAESVCKPKKVLFKVSEVKDTEIMIDKGLIKQLLLNLIFNALESVEEKGQIELKFEAGTDKKIIFILKDNGRGISNNDIKHIFDIYFTKKIDGMGLGLSIARQIAEQHGGTISASSTPGKQTIFKVQIPVKKESQT